MRGIWMVERVLRVAEQLDQDLQHLVLVEQNARPGREVTHDLGSEAFQSVDADRVFDHGLHISGLPEVGISSELLVQFLARSVFSER
jgi:hypothetical protein